MEFLPGAFEHEWERRRAALLHEMQLGRVARVHWDEPRRGGVARLQDDRLDDFGPVRPRRGDRNRHGPARPGTRPVGRSMWTRFSALARGSQPAVVKLASYGSGARAAAMMNYTSRGGELAVENECGERLQGRHALAEQRAKSEHLFDNRAASRDLAVFHVTIAGAAPRSDVDLEYKVREILRSGLGNRRFVYAVGHPSTDELVVSGVVVLRDRSGERLTGDRKAAEIVQRRYNESEIRHAVEARFRFHGYGNGVEWGTARVRALVARTDGDVRDETGRPISGAEQAGSLVQKEWRKELHSRMGRDVMHLIVSARAGTDASAFEAAVREFLGDQFAGHRYVFAIHDPVLDPKEMATGGKRPHIHAHAIVTMRSETGGRIETSPQVFRDWRSAMAERAREQGIDMELTDRRELASAPAYIRKQVRPLSYRGRTEHEGTSHAAHARYQAKRSNKPYLAGSERSQEYAALAAGVWTELASEQHSETPSGFAALQKDRLDAASQNSQTDRVIAGDQAETTKNNVSVVLIAELIKGKVDQMREMTRPEFEAYEKRVEAVLVSVEQALDASDRADFDEVAAAAREVVDIRREYLEFAERQADKVDEAWRRDSREEQRESANSQWDAAVARFGAQAVEIANNVLIRIEHYREGLDRIEAGELPQDYAASYQAGLAREVHRAAEIAVNDDNQYMREFAKTDQDLQRAIELIEVARDEVRRIADGGERDGADPEDTGGQTKGGASALPGVTEAEQNVEARGNRQVAVGHNDHVDDRQVSSPAAHSQQRLDERVAERGSAAEAGAGRSDPPQHHVPRLRQIELEIEERRERNRDNREH